MIRSSPPYLLGPSFPHLKSYHPVFTCQSSPQEGQLWCLLIFHQNSKEGKGKQEDPAWLTWAHWDPPNQSTGFFVGGGNKDHTCRESVYWLDPRTGGTRWRCWERISPVFQSITFMLDSSWFSSLRFQRLDCIHGHGWMPWTVTEHSFGVNVNESILLLSQSHGGQRSLSPLLSALPVSILLSCTLLLSLLSCLCPSLTFSSTLSWHRSSAEPPPSICHPADSLSPSFWDSPLSIACILPLSLPLFPSFVPFLLFILFACFSAWTSAPPSSFCIFLLHPLPPPASSLLTGHLTPPLYPAVSLSCSPHLFPPSLDTLTSFYDWQYFQALSWS